MQFYRGPVQVKQGESQASHVLAETKLVDTAVDEVVVVVVVVTEEDEAAVPAVLMVPMEFKREVVVTEDLEAEFGHVPSEQVVSQVVPSKKNSSLQTRQSSLVTPLQVSQFRLQGSH